MAFYATSTDIWSVGPEDKAKHEQIFQTLNPINGKLSGEQSKKYFMKSNLPTPVLGQIWSLSDLDRDGRMTLQEFSIAMHLIENKLKGVEIPHALPASLRTSTSPSHHGFPSSQLLQPMPSAVTSMTPMNMGMSGAINHPLSGHMGNSMGGMPVINSVGGILQPMPNQGMFSIGGMPQQQQMNKQSPHLMSSVGYATSGPIGRVGSLPTSVGFGLQSQPPTLSHSHTLPTGFNNYNNQPIFGHGVSGSSLKGPGSLQTNSLDVLAMDSFKNLSTGTPRKLSISSGQVPMSTTIGFGNITASNKLKYTQMFKAADNERTGFLSGENARQLLIQSNIDPQLLAQIWELSDINKDGRLELDEFVIAMHLIDTVKMGGSLPQKLPVDMIPTHLQTAGSEKIRSGSVGDGQQLPGTFEDRRKLNWDKGQMELERRRRELQESEQRIKEDRERKEREEEERKRRVKEEQEQKRQQDLENKKRQQEEIEREHEMLRKKMIEERLAAQLAAEKQRQIEWENRRKEELLNQKQHEQSIVDELRKRLNRLKDELLEETLTRDALSASYERKKTEGLELHAAIENLVKSKENRMKDITRLQTQLQELKTKLDKFIQEREKFTLELNQKDSTQTSEALGAIKSSVEQMKLSMTRLKKNLTSLEVETAAVLKESNLISEQHKELKSQLQFRVNENIQLKQQCEMKKREEFDRRKAIEVNEKRMEERNKQIQKKLEADLKNLREREEEAMRKEKQIQETSQNQRLEARKLAKMHAEATIQKQLKSKDELVQQQEDAFNVKIPPTRPRSRPQTTPSKQPMNISSVDFSQFNQPKKQVNFFEANFDQSTANAKKDGSSAVADSKSNNPDVNWFASDFSVANDTKTPPPRPTMPAVTIVADTKEDVKKKQKEEEKRRKKEEEAKKKTEEAEKKRLEKEKEEIEKLKREQAEKDRIYAEKLQKEQEDEKRRKEEEVKRKVEEMQRKRMEKKQAAATQKPASQNPSPPQRPTPAAKPVQEYVKKTMYKMMFDFEARNPDELTVSEGEIIQVDENDTTAPAGWFRGTYKGNVGLFPANYGSKIQNDNFSEYVDLDPRAVNQEIPNQTARSEQPKPQARKPSKKDNAPEPIPKLRSVPTVAPVSNAGTRPKSALLPTTTLKALQPIKKQKTTNQAQVGSYDYVGPATPATVEHTNTDDLYATPIKSKSLEDLSATQTASTEDLLADQSPFPEDIYQVPGEVLPASDGIGEIIQATALYPYLAKKDDSLSFSKNDIINVQQQQGQWWFGECNGKSGWFPKSYVKPVGTRSSGKLSQQEGRGETSETSVNLNTPTETITPFNLGECVAMFDYTGQDGDLSFHQGDTITLTKDEGEWWEGTLNGITGLFPANYVQMKEGEPQIIVNKKPEVAQVITKYVANSDNEISFNAGQLVHVLQKNSNGWWQGELQVRGKNKPNGWFPGNHVKLMLKSKQEATTQSLTSVSPGSTTSSVDTPQSSVMQEDIYSVPTKKNDRQEQVLAMFSYTAQNEDELTFYKGSVINVVSKDGDWWKGELNGAIGVFPYNYVQALRSDKQEVTSQWSGSFDSSLLKTMSKAERQRQNHIYELINTEQNYVNDLSLTLEVFYNPLAESKMLSETELHTVFINWKELIMCNMKFLKAMLVRKKMSQTDQIEGIGDIIIEQIPRFTPYIRFCSCMLSACRLLQDKVDKDPEFKAFEKKCAGDSRLSQNLSLSSYLLKPLQRITKYPLVITNILKYTPEDHFDRENLVIGLEKSEYLCSQVNEGVRSIENSNRLEWLQERVNLDGLEEKLVFNSITNCLGQRKYLYHGTLHKHKSNKELKGFLFNDFLLLCRVHSGHSKLNSSLFHPDSDIKLTIYKKPIFLNEVIVKQPSDPEVTDTLFHLSHIDRVYSFRSETKNERNTWVSTLQKASQLFIETEREKRNRATRARSLCESEVGRLVVTIIEGADLHASDPTGTSDPYCEVSMGSQEHRTKVIPKDLNPKWNSQMVFNIKDLDQDVLCISVFDRDFFSPNDFLGRTEVSVKSIMAKGKGPITKRLLLHEVDTGEIVVTLELQNLNFL